MILYTDTHSEPAQFIGASAKSIIETMERACAVLSAKHGCTIEPSELTVTLYVCPISPSWEFEYEVHA